MRRTRPAARMNSPRASRSGESDGVVPLRAMVEGGLGGEGAFGQACSVGGCGYLAELLVGEGEADGAGALDRLAGATAAGMDRCCWLRVVGAVHDACLVPSADALWCAVPFFAGR